MANQEPDWLAPCQKQLNGDRRVTTLWQTLRRQSEDLSYHQRLPQALLQDSLGADAALLQQLLLYGLVEQAQHHANGPARLQAARADCLRVIAEHARDWPEETLHCESDLYKKHLAVVCGHLWIGGTNLLDPGLSLPRSALRLGSLRQRLRFAWLLLRHGRHQWMEQHTYQPFTHLYHREGFHQYYRNMAALLELHPNIKGFFGSSWFYDPALDQLSPHLSYLREPLAWGGQLFSLGPDNSGNATATSSSRRKAMQAGRYHPTSCLLVWPRAGILRWRQAHPE